MELFNYAAVYKCWSCIVDIKIFCCWLFALDNKIQPSVASKLVADFKVTLTFWFYFEYMGL